MFKSNLYRYYSTSHRFFCCTTEVMEQCPYFTKEDNLSSTAIVTQLMIPRRVTEVYFIISFIKM